ncbi:MAG: hypothetical protein QME78_11055 [Thermodesulfobacteriota bacterium]|nr:hypothetical protein [Thermodesulfobacteriota bacterium]
MRNIVIVEKEKKAILGSESGYFIEIAFISTLIFLFIAISLFYFRKEFIYQQTMELLNIEKEMREKERRLFLHGWGEDDASRLPRRKFSGFRLTTGIPADASSAYWPGPRPTTESFPGRAPPIAPRH